MKLKDFINPNRPHNCTFGIEVEMFLAYKHKSIYKIESYDNDDSEHPIYYILNNTENSKYKYLIYKDYYANQLELRSMPYSDIKLAVNDIKEAYNVSIDLLNEYDNENETADVKTFLVPTSALRGMPTTCGMHVHVRCRNMFNLFVNSYPLLMAFMEHSQCSPYHENNLSIRQSMYNHISQASISYVGVDVPKEVFFNDHNRHADIIFNKHKQNGNDRHRIKTVNTLEYRVFDVMWDFEEMKNMLLLFAKTIQHIKTNKPIKYNVSDLLDTRKEVLHTKYSYNKIFDMPNFEIIEELADMFGIEIKRFPLPVKKNYYYKIDEDTISNVMKLINW